MFLTVSFWRVLFQRVSFPKGFIPAAKKKKVKSWQIAAKPT